MLAAGRFGSISRVLSVQPRFLAVLAVLTLAYTGLQGSMVFVPIRIVELGGQPSDVALTYGIASFAEIPGLVLVGWAGPADRDPLARRAGPRRRTACASLSWGVLAIPLAINATRVVTGVWFGALAGARVLIVARLLPEPLQATGQAMGQAATFGARERLRRPDRGDRLRRSRGHGVLRVRRADGGRRRALGAGWSCTARLVLPSEPTSNRSRLR